MNTERRYDIDWLRMIAIGLLLIYHIAIIFQPWAMFIGFIRSDESMKGLWTPMTMLNVWRIPFLFYVSGMGVYFALRKRSWKQLLTERAKRILLPFVFGLLAITPLHMFIFQKYYNLPLDYHAHAGHLWFLGNIFAYVLILLPIFCYLKRMENGRFRNALTSLLSHPAGPFVVMVFFVVEVVAVRPGIFELYAQTWHGFFIGLIAFFFGFLLVYVGQPFWQNVLKRRWFFVALAVVLYAVRWTVFDMSSPHILMAIESNCWIFGIFGFGYKYLNKPSPILKYLSPAAYPVYIIHMFVLYGGAMIILPLEIPVALKFVLIVLFTGVTCLFLYEFVIRRIRLLKPFFGIKLESNAGKEKVDAQLVGQQSGLVGS